MIHPIVKSVSISSLAQFAYFLSLFELVSLLSKAPVTLRQRPQRPYYVLKTWQTQWERDEMQEKYNFQVCSKSLLRSCQDVTASNTPSYVLSRAWSGTHHVLCVFNTFFLRPFRLPFALTARLPRSHRALRDLINSSLLCPHFHSFCKFSWVNYASKREDINPRKWLAVQNMAPVFMLVLSVW